MSAFVGILGFFVFAYGLVRLLLGLFKKSSSNKKNSIWLIVGLILFVIGLSIPSDSKKETKPEVAKVESKAKDKEPNIDEKDTTKKDKVFTIGDTVDIDGYQIRVNDVRYSNEEGYSTPDEGKQFVIMNITITNGTKKKVSFNPLDFSLNEDGVSSTTGFTYADGVDTLKSGDLDVGATVTGNLVAQANTDSKLKLRYEGNMFLKNKEVDITIR